VGIADLFLLFDHDNMLHSKNFVFSTEGHIVPIPSTAADAASRADLDTASLWQKAAQAVAGATVDAFAAVAPSPQPNAVKFSTLTCPNTPAIQQPGGRSVGNRLLWVPAKKEQRASAPQHSSCPAGASADRRHDQRAKNVMEVLGVEVHAGDGVFKLRSDQGEHMTMRVMPKLGVEMSHSMGTESFFYLLRPHEHVDASQSAAVPEEPLQEEDLEMGVTSYYVEIEVHGAIEVLPASNALFGAATGLPSMPIVFGSPADGCSAPAVSNDQDHHESRVVVVNRGACAFVSKVYAAQQAGAAGVIVINTNQLGTELFMMGGDGSVHQSALTIPAVMVSKASGDRIRQLMNHGAVSASFAEHSFESLAMAGSAPSGLRSPALTGNVHDFEFQGMMDWGIRVTRLTDGNYQLMLVGGRFAQFIQGEGAAQGSQPSPPAQASTSPRPPSPPPVPVPNERKATAKSCHVQDKWPRTHKCRTDSDCGIDSHTCQQRSCSKYGFCGN
jgi:hypothetical protein